MTYELKGVESFGFIWESLRNEGFLRSLFVNLRVTVDAIAAEAEKEKIGVNGSFAQVMFVFCIFRMGRTVASLL